MAKRSEHHQTSTSPSLPPRFRIGDTPRRSVGSRIAAVLSVLIVLLLVLAVVFLLSRILDQDNTIDELEQTQQAQQTLLPSLTPTLIASSGGGALPTATPRDGNDDLSPESIATATLPPTPTPNATEQHQALETQVANISRTEIAAALATPTPDPNQVEDAPASLVVWTEGDPVVYAGSLDTLPFVMVNKSAPSEEIAVQVPVGGVADKVENCQQVVSQSWIIPVGTSRTGVYCPPVGEFVGPVEIKFVAANGSVLAALPIEVRRDWLTVSLDPFAVELERDTNGATELTASCPDLDLNRPFYPLRVGLVANNAVGDIPRRYTVTVDTGLTGTFVIDGACSPETQNKTRWVFEFEPGDSQSFYYQPIAPLAGGPEGVPQFTVTASNASGVPMSLLQVVYIRNEANLRAEPAAAAELVKRLLASTIAAYPVISSQSDVGNTAWTWYQVDLGEGNQAWVRSDVITDLSPR
ncbi:MAG: hypothetical protein JXQ72_01785 [Anaerolineae bacterium]|nr:hypothetical protein [Anaerolineae bacterium]